MIIIRFFIYLIFWHSFLLSLLVLYLISLPAALLPHRKQFMYFLGKCFLRFIFFVSFIRVKVEGAGNFPSSGRWVMISDRHSLIDPFYYIAYLPGRVRLIAQPTLIKFPFLGRVVKAMGCIEGPQKGKDVIRWSAELLTALRAQEPVLFFPSNREKAMTVARACGAMIRLLTVQGSDKIMPEDTLLISPGTVRTIIKQ